MSWLDSPLTKNIEHYLDLTNLRENLVVGNLANIDTPNYHTVDVNFEQELHQASLGFPAEASPPRLEEVTGLITRPDGNNVSVDRESMLLSQTQLQFQTGMSLLKNEFTMLEKAITEQP